MRSALVSVSMAVILAACSSSGGDGDGSAGTAQVSQATGTTPSTSASTSDFLICRGGPGMQAGWYGGSAVMGFNHQSGGLAGSTASINSGSCVWGSRASGQDWTSSDPYCASWTVPLSTFDWSTNSSGNVGFNWFATSDPQSVSWSLPQTVTAPWQQGSMLALLGPGQSGMMDPNAIAVVYVYPAPAPSPGNIDPCFGGGGWDLYGDLQ